MKSVYSDDDTTAVAWTRPACCVLCWYLSAGGVCGLTVCLITGWAYSAVTEIATAVRGGKEATAAGCVGIGMPGDAGSWLGVVVGEPAACTYSASVRCCTE
jgi:hypothetical protein